MRWLLSIFLLLLALSPAQAQVWPFPGPGRTGSGGGGCSDSGSPPFTDAFTGTNGTVLPTYSANYTQTSTDDADLHIFSNAIDHDRSAGTQESHRYKWTPGTICATDQFFRVQFVNVNTGCFEAFLRVQSDNTAYEVRVCTTTVNWQAVDIDLTTETSIDSSCTEGAPPASFAIAVGDWVLIKITGTGTSTQVVIIDYDTTDPGVVPASFPSPGADKTCTLDADPASPIDVGGQAGVASLGSASNTRFDNTGWGAL